ncbi:hypothetical protein AVEN_62614-1 [Araneus ventricosus]|uniref:Uncharacterized protein n=1 Tax=Araneus ventricosus TaxID=182803 RepID=A0A4Y2U978_ARAVE|nr:hypothetical protein AVEN_62614-1 [Araneus ventricosus]
MHCVVPIANSIEESKTEFCHWEKRSPLRQMKRAEPVTPPRRAGSKGLFKLELWRDEGGGSRYQLLLNVQLKALVRLVLPAYLKTNLYRINATISSSLTSPADRKSPPSLVDTRPGVHRGGGERETVKSFSYCSFVPLMGLAATNKGTIGEECGLWTRVFHAKGVTLVEDGLT